MANQANSLRRTLDASSLKAESLGKLHGHGIRRSLAARPQGA